MDLTGARWRKASRSSANGGNCVEVAAMTRMVAVRDSKDPDGPKLGITRTQWSALLGNAKAGRFDS